MLDHIADNPTVATIITMLLVTVGAFLKGTILSGVSHEKQMTQLRADFDERLDRAEELTRKAESRADQWMEIAMRTTGAARDLIDVAKNRDVKDVRDSEERESRR